MFQPAYPNAGLAPAAAAISTTRPSDASAHGVDMTALRGVSRYTIKIDADAARTITSPTGGSSGVELWGCEQSQWSLIGLLNNGADITIIADTQSWSVTVDLGRSYDRLEVAGTKSAGTVTKQFIPIEVGA